jgi:hypothetical protein
MGQIEIMLVESKLGWLVSPIVLLHFVDLLKMAVQ